MESFKLFPLLGILMLLLLMTPPAVCDPRCSKIVLHAWCSAESTHRFVHALSSCDRDHVVGMLERRCRLNERGHYCGSFADYITDIQVATVECLYWQAEGNDSICSETCREKLQLLRRELGCCINEMLNASRKSWLYNKVFNWTLWEDCEVDVPPDSCLPSPLFRSLTSSKSNCSRDEVFRRSNLVTCNRTMLNPLLKMYESHGCTTIGEDQMNTCGVDQHRQWCLKSLVSKIRTLSALTRSAAIHCPRTDECSPECKRNLYAMRETMGCCLTNSLNNTFVELIYAETYNYFKNFTSYALWKTCGVPHPGYCEVVLHTSDSTTHTGMRATIFSAVLVMVCFVMNALPH